MRLVERLVGKVVTEKATSATGMEEVEVEARATVAVGVVVETATVAALPVAGLHRQHLHPLHASRWAQHPNH